MLGLPERRPLPRLDYCRHCGNVVLNRASYNGALLCFPSAEQVEEGAMHCYQLVSVSHHEMPCVYCQTGVPYDGHHAH